MVVHHQLLPAGYLLALSPATAAAPETRLALHLARACRSGKPAVWVDCHQLDTLSPTAAWLLWACQQQLARRQARLILCQVPAPVERALRCALASLGDNLYIVPTLADAAALAA